jgi:hypothetical protein
VQRRLVQAEPARPLRRRRVRIDRDDLQVGRRKFGRCDVQQAVVRAHEGVSAARPRGHAEVLFTPAHALLQIGGADHQMVECRRHSATSP